MTERMDPTDLWRQWYEMGSKVWTGALQNNGENYMDPWSLYRQWFEGMENMRDRTMKSMGSIGNGSQAADMWQKGMDATMEGWRKSAETSTEMMGMAPRWMEMLDQARENMMSVEQLPKDPLEFAVQWYNATSGLYSEFVQEAIEREEFLDQGSRFLQNYASFYKIFKRGSEEYLHNIQVPTRSDITRVASLIVTLEEKVDRIEDTVEDMQDASAASLTEGKIGDLEKRLGKFEDEFAKRSDKTEGEMSQRIDRVESKLDAISTAVDRPADTSAVESLDGRITEVEGKLDQVENKLDQVLAALENVSSNSGASATETPATNAPANASANAPETKATDAARRKAQDMSVNLADVNGTGADGQITVEDVRKKGEN